MAIVEGICCWILMIYQPPNQDKSKLLPWCCCLHVAIVIFAGPNDGHYYPELLFLDVSSDVAGQLGRAIEIYTNLI